MLHSADRPAVSVVTVCYNAARCLDQCLESVHRQQGLSWEHLLVDGGSTDGSLEIIGRRSPALAWWISEPDGGIAEAMNKGAAKTCGEWLLFLHADDELLHPQALADCLHILSSSIADVVGFPVRFGQVDRYRLRKPRNWHWWLNLKTIFQHQATFIRRSFFAASGGYDPRFRIVMDYEFFLRAYRLGAVLETHQQPIPALMRDSGLSSRRDWASLESRLAEERLAQGLHARSPISAIGYRLWWAAYLPYRRLRAWM